MKPALLGVAIFLAMLKGSNAPATSVLRTLNVAVLDNQGKPAPGLLATDFFVFEDGRPRQVLFSRFTGVKPTPLQPGEVSNRTRASSPTVVLIDLLSDRRISDTILAKQMGDYLRQSEPGNDLYVYLLTRQGELYPVRALGTAASPDTASLLDEAIKKFAVFKPADDFDLQIQFNLTSAALRKLGSQMQPITGRKNLVWVTHGVPLQGPSITRSWLDFTMPVRDLASSFAHSEVAVYTVEQSLSGAGEDVGTNGGRTLDLFTAVTGGRRYRTDRAIEAIQQAKADSQANYQIVYNSAVMAADGKRHKIRVDCSRRDVRLQTQQEFSALAFQPPPPDFERRAFEAAAKAPSDTTEIGLRASVSTGSAPNTMRVDLRIDTEDLMLREPADRVIGKVSVLFATYDGEKLVQASRPIPLDVSLTEQQYEAAAHGALEFHQEIPVASNIQKVRAIVVDGTRAAVGSVTIPVEAAPRPPTEPRP